MAHVAPRIAHITFALILTASACSTIARLNDPCGGSLPDAAVDATIALEGYYRSSFEISSFVPCGCDIEPGHGAGYWLTPAPGSGFHEAYSPLVDETDPFRPGPEVYTRFEGSLSEYGTHGHMGAYLRQVTVYRLIEINPDGQCP